MAVDCGPKWRPTAWPGKLRDSQMLKWVMPGHGRIVSRSSTDDRGSVGRMFHARGRGGDPVERPQCVQIPHGRCQRHVTKRDECSGAKGHVKQQRVATRLQRPYPSTDASSRRGSSGPDRSDVTKRHAIAIGCDPAGADRICQIDLMAFTAPDERHHSRRVANQRARAAIVEADGLPDFPRDISPKVMVKESGPGNHAAPLSLRSMRPDRSCVG